MPYGGGHDEDLVRKHSISYLKMFLSGGAIFFLFFTLTLIVMVKPYMTWVLLVFAILLLLHKAYAAFVESFKELQ